jgi:hypothetical protein
MLVDLGIWADTGTGWVSALAGDGCLLPDNLDGEAEGLQLAESSRSSTAANDPKPPFGLLQSRQQIALIGGRNDGRKRWFNTWETW